MHTRLMNLGKKSSFTSSIFTHQQKVFSTKTLWDTKGPHKKPDFADQYIEVTEASFDKSSALLSLPPVMDYLQLKFEHFKINLSELSYIYKTAVFIEKDFEKIRGDMNIRDKYKYCDNFKNITNPDHGITAFKWLVRERLVNILMAKMLKDLQVLITNGQLTECELLSSLIMQELNYLPANSLDNIRQEASIKAIHKLIDRTNSFIVIPNRGIIANKVIQTAANQRYKTIHVCHKNDKIPHADHVLILDDYKDYNNVNKIMEKLNSFRKNLPPQSIFYLHPCYGYTSENPHMPSACEKNNIIFIGPSADSMLAFGDKSKARMIAKSLNIPVVPGDDGENQDRTHLLKKGKELGFPIMVKTTDGGGGTGNRIAHSATQLENILTTTLTGNVILEKFLVNPKHFEVQLAIDKNNVVILSTRDCSMQRRYQKIIEIAPAQTPHAKKLLEYASLIGNEARRLGYTGVMTAEFLQDGDEIVFNENNTRIQVEHSVTEDIYDHAINIAALQIHIATGNPMHNYFKTALASFDTNLTLQQNIDEQEKNAKTKVSIEARINAQELLYDQEYDSSTKGKITTCMLPELKRRGHIDSDVTKDMEIDTAHVNSLIMTLRGVGANKEEALYNLKHLLSETLITGIDTNLDYLKSAVEFMQNSSTPLHVETCRQIDKLHTLELEELKLEEEKQNKAYSGGFRC